MRWQIAPDLYDLARRIIQVRREVAHVDLEEVLFLRELLSSPGGKNNLVLGRCYRLVDHPIGLFVPHRFAIVFYWSNLDYFTPEQLALLMLHEMMHIPRRGDKLVDHTIKDFAMVLGIGGVDWAGPGAEVPDILQGEL